MRQPPKWIWAAVLAVGWLVPVIASSMAIMAIAPYRGPSYFAPIAIAAVLASGMIHGSWKVPVLLCVFAAIALVIGGMILLATHNFN